MMHYQMLQISQGKLSHIFKVLAVLQIHSITVRWMKLILCLIPLKNLWTVLEILTGVCEAAPHVHIMRILRGDVQSSANLQLHQD
jgi:hypothetical protein